ncbi:SDR family oxidoreductase [Diaphorobacter aerolatus]|uniref:SDR family oxidoreductase n=1 Tax=Diaphorobacter aerolatus TaxID=1288495 RepID=A0A7H0GFT3_9BURK|nr:SDR family oxidoreductase [Diaphorobacter aerolatus]QNP47149.1 SDR family oxidoreductase [Diaphorobacter aerolatus]
MNSLKGKVALVTGGSSGIGRAAALLFASEGASVVIGARSEQPLRELVAEIEHAGGNAVQLAGDVGHEDYMQQLAATAVRSFGRLDIAFNNAGTLGPMGPTEGISLNEWNAALQTNLTSAFLAAKHQVPQMLKQQHGGASIVFTGTFVGYTVGFPGVAAYAASKAGLVGLAQALAVEYGPRGIRANVLLPGGTDTPMGRQMSNTPEALAAVANLHALKRLATPEEIARAALFLASDASAFMTGAAMLVDGGVSVNRG